MADQQLTSPRESEGHSRLRQQHHAHSWPAEPVVRRPRVSSSTCSRQDGQVFRRGACADLQKRRRLHYSSASGLVAVEERMLACRATSAGASDEAVFPPPPPPLAGDITVLFCMTADAHFAHAAAAAATGETACVVRSSSPSTCVAQSALPAPCESCFRHSERMCACLLHCSCAKKKRAEKNDKKRKAESVEPVMCNGACAFPLAPVKHGCAGATRTDSSERVNDKRSDGFPCHVRAFYGTACLS